MPSRAAGERNGLRANSGTTPARALERPLQRRVPALWKRGRFRKGLRHSRKSGRRNLARGGRDGRRSHPLRPSRVQGPRDETRQHERTPESSEAASHMDGPDRFAKLARYHNHPWCRGHRVDHQSAVISKALDWDHAWGLPAPPIISMAVFSTAAVRFLRRFAFGRSR